MRIAIAQGPSPAGSEDRALSALAASLDAAAAAGARAALFPELYLPGYNVADPGAGARDAAGWDALLGPFAAKAGCALALGVAERDGAALFNSAMVWGAEGRRLALYRKTQLYGARERRLFAPGDRLALFDLAGVRTALLICYDVEFPPLLRTLADRGAGLILCPTANMQPFAHVPALTVPAQAAIHGIAIAYANHCGREGDLAYTGGSRLVSADGTVLAMAGPGPALLVADLAPADPALLSTQARDFRPVE